MAGELPHLKIDTFFSSKQYLYPKQGFGPEFNIVERNRAIHGNKIIQQLNAIKRQFAIDKEKELPEEIVKDDVVYVEFFSQWNFPLKFESLTQERDNPSFQILNIKKEVIENNGNKAERFKVVVMMKEGAISTFLKKAAQYLTENTKDKDGHDTGKPKNEALIANIQDLELATLRSFWSDEPEISFPESNEVVWWEIWFRRTGDDEPRMRRVIQNLEALGATTGRQVLSFPEHFVRLVKASATQLASSLILLDNLAELRKPQQLNDFITSKNVDLQSKDLWVEDLLSRIEVNLHDESVIICLLDSGINNKHPLLYNLLPDGRLYSYKDSWGTEDSWDSGGHGTGMGGLALYGDLTLALSQSGSIKIHHGIESFKIVHPDDPNDPEFYGVITEYACTTPTVDYPNNPRIYCLSITDKERAFNGRPSTWSSVIDRISFGRVLESPQLFIVSGGNVNYMQPQVNATNFPTLNYIESIHDPSQAYNALTVGSYTRMDRINQQTWPGINALAQDGGISPSNSTSLMWDDQWPIKPDIVMEGGNLAKQGTQIMDHVDTLKPLSLDKDFRKYIFSPFGDTSGAAALASKLAAELKTEYPQYWPETIRALMVHSADWTDRMLGGVDLKSATVNQKRNLLRTFGYGTPIAKNAFYSAKNALTLIAENQIQPFKRDGASVKTNEYHLYSIPWPADVLQNLLTDKDVKLKVTLSYFIDPNPGNRRYANNFSYHSHSLDFKMIRPTEDLEQFKRRVSAVQENGATDYIGTEEPWLLKESMRNKGSIKKDFVISSGADLATRHTIAIYPKNGWYSSRKKLGMAETVVRYSLIVSIETEETNVDIYNPVYEMIRNSITITS